MRRLIGASRLLNRLQTMAADRAAIARRNAAPTTATATSLVFIGCSFYEAAPEVAWRSWERPAESADSAQSTGGVPHDGRPVA